MLNSSECRKLAAQCRAKALAPGFAPNKATVPRNIANSFSALAGQLETLAVYEKTEPGRASTTL